MNIEINLQFKNKFHVVMFQIFDLFTSTHCNVFFSFSQRNVVVLIKHRRFDQATLSSQRNVTSFAQRHVVFAMLVL
jgi:hypothetical protein